MAGTKKKVKAKRGQLKIGDSWNAITIIALSQNNPLKAIAEFVENSIDAKAKKIRIIRGKEKGETYLKIIDDGGGVHKDETGSPNFEYVATHICDSIKRKLKARGEGRGQQGEFGIGLLSFWTVGRHLSMICPAADSSTWQMDMEREKPGYSVSHKRTLLPGSGTQLIIRGLLHGIRSLSGDKLEAYLSEELRDRIRSSGVDIVIVDKISRKEIAVVPRLYEGRLLTSLPVPEDLKDILKIEIHLAAYNPENAVALFRNGTRVLPSLSMMDDLKCEPWTGGWLQGMVDASFLQLTPGTRDGFIRDENYQRLLEALQDIGIELMKYVGEQKSSDEEQSQKSMHKAVEKALKEAFLSLPREEYDWIDAYGLKPSQNGNEPADLPGGKDADDESADIYELSGNAENPSAAKKDQMKFFEHAGPLFRILISPRAAVLPVEGKRTLQAKAFDRKRIAVDDGVNFLWEIIEGEGCLISNTESSTELNASNEPGIIILKCTASQGEIICEAQSTITVTAEIGGAEEKPGGSRKGLPSYTFIKAPGERWRSRFDDEKNIIEVNRSHSDFIFASKSASLKLRYLCRLFCKEMVLHNFPGADAESMLERLIELNLYAEENLKMPAG